MTTVREALFAEMLGEVDTLLKRVEHLPVMVESCEERLSRQAAMLEEAGKRYGRAVSGFTQESKAELAAFLEKEAKATSAEQADAIRQLVRAAIKAESDTALAAFSDAIPKHRYSWLLAHGVTALCAALLTALLMRFAG